MSTAVIGATGRIGSEIVRGLLARGDAVAALVRDPGKARGAFGEPGGLRIRPTRLDDPRDLTGALDGIRTVFIAMGSVPLSWPEALKLLSAELGEPVTFKVAAERQFLDCLTGAVIPAGTAELLITREWAILAGENDYTTGTFAQITGRPPRPLAEFLHQYRAEFT